MRALACLRACLSLSGWALGVVSSRAFATRGPSQPSALLPLIDMCNHCFEPNVEVLPVGAGAGAAAAAAGATAGPGGAMAMFAKRKVRDAPPFLLHFPASWLVYVRLSVLRFRLSSAHTRAHSPVVSHRHSPTTSS